MPLAPTKTRIGVLRGGPSPEYDVSLKTGGVVLANLPENCIPIDIFVSKDGIWHVGGQERDPHKILGSLYMVWNAMHGAYGEDGRVQKMLEEFRIPYTGSSSLASALGMNKIMAKDIFRRANLKTPYSLAIEQDGDYISNSVIKQIHQSLPFPLIFKPVNSGSSLGISVVENPSQIKEALQNSFAHGPKVLIEEFIDGKEVTCGVIEGFRGKDLYTLLPVQVERPKRTFYDYAAKYRNLEHSSRIQANLSNDEKMRVAEATALIHKPLGLRHYSRGDFIMHPRRGLFVLEVNTLPELSHRSSFIKSLEAVGSNIKEFLSHIISKTVHR